MVNDILTDTRSITYSRETGDFDAYLNGQYIGSFGSYLAAEIELDRIVSNQIEDTRILLADEAADRAAETSTEAPLLVERLDYVEACVILESIRSVDYSDYSDIETAGTRAYLAQFGYKVKRSDVGGLWVPANDWRAVSGERVDPPVDSPEPLPPWECRNCETNAHPTYACPEVLALVLAPATPCRSCGDLTLSTFCRACRQSGEDRQLAASNGLLALEFGLTSARRLVLAIDDTSDDATWGS